MAKYSKMYVKLSIYENNLCYVRVGVRAVEGNPLSRLDRILSSMPSTLFNMSPKSI